MVAPATWNNDNVLYYGSNPHPWVSTLDWWTTFVFQYQFTMAATSPPQKSFLTKITKLRKKIDGTQK